MEKQESISFALANRVAEKFAQLPQAQRSARNLVNIIHTELISNPGAFTNEDVEREVRTFKDWETDALIQTISSAIVKRLTDSQMINILAIATILDTRGVEF